MVLIKFSINPQIVPRVIIQNAYKEPSLREKFIVALPSTLVSDLRWSYLSRPPLIHHSFALFDHQNVMFVCSFTVEERLQSLAVIMRLHCLFTVS